MSRKSRDSKRILRALQELPQAGDQMQHEAILRQLHDEIQALPAEELDRLWRDVQRTAKQRQAPGARTAA